MHSEDIFFQAFVYLTAAVVSVPLAKRLGLGSVLGYLLAGMAIGPFGLRLVGEEQQDVMHFAEFGVVMMLFLIGLELRPARLWRMRRPILGLGGLQVAITALALGGIARAAGLNASMSIAVGMILALSSTAIVLQSLQEKGLMKTEAGQSSFSVLLFQDIAVIPMLAVLPLLATIPPGITGDAAPLPTGGHPAGDMGAGWAHALMVLGAVAAIVLAGRFLIRHVFRFIAETGLREIFTAAALLLVISITLAMQAVGLSPALGTFLGGVVLADNEYRHEIETDVEPFKGLLLGLFFITVGASIDFALILDRPGLMAGLVAGLVAVKITVLFVLGKVFGMERRGNATFALALAQGGEFAFVLFAFAARHRVLPPEVADPLIGVVALSMAATPLLLILNERVVQRRLRPARTEREPDAIDQDEAPVIIAGYGRFGQIVGRLLQANGFAVTVLELDPGQIELLRKFGHKVFYGNASRVDLLRAAGAEHARLLVLCVDNRETTLEMVDLARRHFPGLKILARAHDRVHAYELMKRGVDLPLRETFDAALRMGEESLKALGMRGHQAHRSARIFREFDETSMAATATLWGGDQKAYIFERHKYRDMVHQVLQADREDSPPAADHAWDVSEQIEEAGGDPPPP
jgi:monovalent cation:proton antiporter-2 (CPA2) family protein